MLTIKQAKLLDYLIKSFKNNRVSPSFEEMRINLGLSSKSGVHRLINGLEERGFKMARCHMPEAMFATDADWSTVLEIARLAE